MDTDDPTRELVYWGGGSEAALTVGHLTRYLASLVQEDEILQDVWVRGEVSQVTLAASGHLYFSLRDADACLGCVMWRHYASLLPLLPETGMELLVHGRLTIYGARGQYNFEVDDFEPEGEGEQHLDFEQATERLRADGLFDPARKRPLPPFPKRVAVITSLSGAAVRDICVTLHRERFAPEIILIPALVQGDGAEASLCESLRLANDESGADLILIGRGGGSAEDLAAFNAERVARAIAGSRLPVISAVGHETDFCLADLAADARAATPTAAAEMVLARRAQVLDRLGRARAHAQALFQSRLDSARVLCEGLRRRAPLARPQWLIEGRRARMEVLQDRLKRARDLCVSRARHRFTVAVGKLEELSPLGTLARGFAVVSLLPDGTPVRGVEALSPGDGVRVRLADGTFESRITRVERGGPGGEGGSEPDV